MSTLLFIRGCWFANSVAVVCGSFETIVSVLENYTECFQINWGKHIVVTCAVLNQNASI